MCMCWEPKCLIAKAGAAVCGALALTLFGATFAGQLAGKTDFVTTAGGYLAGLILLFAAKKLMWCCCCCGMPAKRKK